MSDFAVMNEFLKEIAAP